MPRYGVEGHLAISQTRERNSHIAELQIFLPRMSQLVAGDIWPLHLPKCRISFPNIIPSKRAPRKRIYYLLMRQKWPLLLFRHLANQVP